MVARLLSGMFGAKATLLSGVIVVASAVASGPAQTADVAPVIDDSASVNASAAREELVPFVAAPQAAPAVAPRPLEVPRAAEPSSAAAGTAAGCALDTQTRDASLQTIRDSFTSAHAALTQLGAARRSASASTTIERARTMLANVDRTAEDLVGTSASCAADMREVTDRAAHAMEMIVDLAKTATAPTPTPAPTKKPLPTKKPEPTPKKR